MTTTAIGLGCMGLSQGYGVVPDDQAVATVRAARDAGVTLFDTAQSYGQGANEQLLARSLGRAEQVATKLGIVRTADGVGLDAAPQRVRGYCEASLRRLGREVIDLYYLHRVDPIHPIEEQIGALAALVEAGLVRHIGVSEVTPDQLRRAAAVAPLAAVQFEWSLAWRAPEAEIVPVARELGIGLVAYSPLGRGLLTADAASQDPGVSGFRRNDPRFAGTALTANRAQAEAVRELADELGATPGQVALAWLLAQGEDVVALPGSRRPERVRENAAATRLVLDAAASGRLDRISRGFVGDRSSFAAAGTERAASD